MSFYKKKMKKNIRQSELRSTKKNVNFLRLFFLLCFLFVAGFFVHEFYDEKNTLNVRSLSEPVDEPYTLEERISQRQAELKIKTDIRIQEKKLEQINAEPIGEIDPLGPTVPSLDMGAIFPENRKIQSIAKDLDEKPFVNDLYEDPEDIIGRQIENREWLEKYLKDKNDEQKRQFVEYFIAAAKEQGFKVHFTEDLKVILEPIDPDEKPKFENMKINWK